MASGRYLSRSVAMRDCSPSAAAAELAGTAMQPDGGARGEVARALGHESGDQAREDVAGAAGGQRGGAGGIDPDAAVGEAMRVRWPLRTRRTLRSAAKAAGDAKTILLHLGGGEAGEARHLAGMRREHAQMGGTREIGPASAVQAVGIDDHGQRRFRQRGGGRGRRYGVRCRARGRRARTVFFSATWRIALKLTFSSGSVMSSGA